MLTWPCLTRLVQNTAKRPNYRISALEVVINVMDCSFEQGDQVALQPSNFQRRRGLSARQL